MNALLDFAGADARWIALLADATIKGSIVLLLAGVLTLVRRRASAAERHLVWSVALGSVLAIPVLTLALPAWRVAVLPPASEAAPVAPTTSSAPVADAVITEQRAELAAHLAAELPVNLAAGQAQARRDVPAATPDESRAAPPRPAAQPMSSSESPSVTATPTDWTSWALRIWMIGATLILVPFIVGFGRVWWLARTAVPVRSGPWAALARQILPALGLERSVRVLESPEAAMPMAWGIMSPVVLLPADAEEWSEERRRDVLVHELSHVKRNDCLTQLLAQIACAAFWFNPLVWVAARQLRAAREEACDDQVLQAGARASDYAAHLLDVARSLRPVGATSFATVAMARRSQLADRLLAILDEQRSRHAVTRRAALPVWALAIAIVLPIAAFTPAARDAAASVPTLSAPASTVSSPTPSAGAATSRLTSAERPAPASDADDKVGMGLGTPPLVPDVEAPKPATAGDSLEAQALATVVPAGEPCWTNSNGTTSSTVHEDTEAETRTVRIRRGRCRLDLEMEGRVRFNEELTDVVSISSGGKFELEETDEVKRRVEIESVGGTLRRRYFVDGAERPFDAEAQRWLGETILTLERRSGFLAEQRTAQLLSRGGVPALLTEVEQLQSDHVRRRYLGKALESGRVTPAEASRILEIAGRDVRSDYELATLLITMAKADLVSQANAAAYVSAVRSISSDYERRRALTELLKGNALDQALVPRMLEVASTMSSDYELASLLIDVANKYVVDEGARPAFFRAVGSISSDYERRRVLAAVLRREPANRAVLLDLVTAGGTIGSGYERSQFLKAMAPYVVSEPTIRSAFFTAVRGISSDYERRGVLTTLLARPGVDETLTIAIIEAGQGMGSDYERAEFLIAVARRNPESTQVREAIEKAADNLSSEHEYGRVMSALRRRSARTGSI